MVRGTTNPAPCCHLCNWLVNASPLLPPSEWQWLSELWPVIKNNLTFDPLTRLLELTQNWMRSSHSHSTPSLKISCKSVQPFSRNVADKETNKQRKKRKKERNRSKTIPRPPIGGGVKIYKRGEGVMLWAADVCSSRVALLSLGRFLRSHLGRFFSVRVRRS